MFETFHERLREELERRKMSQGDLARAAGLKMANMNHICTGRVIPSMKSLCSIIKALKGVDISWLVTGDSSQDRNQHDETVARYGRGHLFDA